MAKQAQASKRARRGAGTPRLARREIVCEPRRLHAVKLAGLAAPTFFYFRVVLDPQPGDNKEVFVTINGLAFQNDVPATVLVRPRQSVNAEMGWSDVFGTQVVQTNRNYLVVHVMRLDQRLGGWSQQLELDFLVVDSAS